MVESVVSFAAQRLGDLLIQEAVFLHGVREQVQQLCNELRRMQCFLKDADAKQGGNELVRNWVAEIRDAAYDAEDVIDTFILKVNPERRGSIHDFFTRRVPIVNKWIHYHDVGTKIQAILARLQDISSSRIRYSITDVGDGEASRSTANKRLHKQLRQSFPHIGNEDVIGSEEHTEALVAELMKEEDRCCVVSIVGIGGLGKTTLAKKVYMLDFVKGHFDCCAWTFISQQYDRRDILQDILKKFSTPTDIYEMKMIREMTEENLVEKVYDYLQEKRYLVVLDDIWSLEAWDIISPAFPSGKRGSKVLLTTRNKEVALHADPWSLHLEPRLLNDEQSWRLLCKKVFPKNVIVPFFSPDLEELGREMASRCGGLPLGIIVLGGLLASRRLEVSEWEVVRRNITAHMNKGQNGGVLGILSLSYNDLPHHLKPCFLYLGLFPEDYEIPIRKLIRLWIAEGFIPFKREEVPTMEDVGENQYLAELIQRCMVQIDKKSFTGRVKTCRVHDLMRDLCLSKAREDNFLDIHQQHAENIATNSSILMSLTNYRLRRLAIHVQVQGRYHSSYAHLRTLLVIPRDNFFFTSSCRYHNFKLLRVLDFWGGVTPCRRNITEEVGKLIHLRYLALGGDRFEMPISPSIGNLRYLQTLKLTQFRGWLPEAITRMRQLRYLHVSPTCRFRDGLQVDKLINLRTLKGVRAGAWMTKGGFVKLTNIQKLDIYDLLRSQVEVILPAIVDRSSSVQNPLRSLKLHCAREEDFPNLEALSRCCNLRKLQLSGLCNSEDLRTYPPNLTKLILTSNYLSEDPMASLQHLPNLKYLHMENSYTGEEMDCSAKGFPQLQYLYLSKLKELKDWRVDQGGMPSLNHLDISDCDELRMLPEGLRFITSLQQLMVSSMPLVFQGRVVIEGEDWYKVQHIPSITISQSLGLIQNIDSITNSNCAQLSVGGLRYTVL